MSDTGIEMEDETMIRGNAERRIKEVWLKDGSKFSATDPGEELFGIPYSWTADNSLPWIERRKDGKILQSINVNDYVESIVFEV